MYICICKKVTDRQIRRAVIEDGVNNLRELRGCLGACDQCGKCAIEARNIISESKAERSLLESEALPVG